MQFFLCEIVARIVAIYLCVDCYRKIRNGLVQRKIAYFNDDAVDWLLIDWSKWLIERDAAPIRYWITIGLQTTFLLACLFVAVFGWQPST